VLPFSVGHTEHLRPKCAAFGADVRVRDEGDAVPVASRSLSQSLEQSQEISRTVARNQLAAAGQTALHVASETMQLSFFCTAITAGVSAEDIHLLFRLRLPCLRVIGPTRSPLVVAAPWSQRTRGAAGTCTLATQDLALSSSCPSTPSLMPSHPTRQRSVEQIARHSGDATVSPNPTPSPPNHADPPPRRVSHPAQPLLHIVSTFPVFL
jgi:hypothetical protein